MIFLSRWIRVRCPNNNTILSCVYSNMSPNPYIKINYAVELVFISYLTVYYAARFVDIQLEVSFNYY